MTARLDGVVALPAPPDLVAGKVTSMFAPMHRYSHDVADLAIGGANPNPLVARSAPPAISQVIEGRLNPV